MRFHYSGIDQNGLEESGTIDADTEANAFQSLTARGIRPFALSAQASTSSNIPWYKRDIKFASQQFNLAEQASLASLFSILLGQKIPLVQLLRLLVGSTKNKRIHRHFLRVEQSVSEGSTFGNAFSEGPEAHGFSPLFHDVAYLVDQSDQAETAFRRLSGTLQRQHQIRSKLRSAFLYPGILILVALGVLGIMVSYLAPALSPMFVEMGQPLPTALTILMAMNRFFSAHAFPTISLILICLGAIVLLWKQPAGTMVRNRIAYSLPVLGKLQKNAALLNQVEMLSLLLHAQIPLVQALEKCADHKGRNAESLFPFTEASVALRAGRQSSTVISTASALPTTLRELYKLGEQTNQLTEFLEGGRVVLEAEHRQQIDRAMTLLTPVLTLVLGLGIGALIYSVMSAILEINHIAF